MKYTVFVLVQSKSQFKKIFYFLIQYLIEQENIILNFKYLITQKYKAQTETNRHMWWYKKDLLNHKILETLSLINS